MRSADRLLIVLMAASLGACAGKKTARTDEPPTLKTLADRSVDIGPDPGIKGGPDDAIAAYKKFLDTSPKAPQRAEALRRLGDLEMDSVDERQVAGTATGTASDYKAAIGRYQDYLRQYPNDPGNDRVLYQLSRAQEQGGELEASLKTLDALVAKYPKTAFIDEAQFRRGELLFATRDYGRAEKAYATVLAGETDRYRDRALYMQGWSQFKQGKLEEGLQAFFGVLDLKIANREGEGGLETLEDLSRADRELVEDTFRVMSLSLANLQGSASIPPYIDSDDRRSYEFRVYEQLGELYLKQERVKDAADTFGAFARLRPLHAQAPQLQARVIEIYQRNGFANLALEAKKDYVTRYGVDSEFRRANEAGWEKAQPLVKTHLAELAQHYHASAQKSKLSADYQEAVKWYRASLASFPDDEDAAKTNFLLAELLFEDGQFADAAKEYEKTAYAYPIGPRSADAGYAALLAYANQEKKADAAQKEALQRAAVDSSLRYASTFPADQRTGMVLTNSAEKLFALKDERASGVAQQVLALNPPAPAAQRRVAWTVIAHNAFDRKDYATAEKAYGEVLALVPEKDAARGELTERLAASVYRQGEAARTAGNAPEAVKHFERVAAVAPNSAVRATAQYDAAAALIGLKDWPAATRLLEDFRIRFPKHALQDDVTTKLAVAYTEQQQWSAAAAEYERIATAKASDPAIAGAAVWQSAELYEKANARPAATKAYERYLKQYAHTLDTNLEARLRLARLAKADGNKARELALMKEITEVDRRAGAQRTDRSRYLAATATLALAEPTFEAYRKVDLVEPLARQLKLKKAKMEDVLKAYAAAADYGVAEVTTASTYQTAALYQDFGRAMIKSERPKKLSKIELEQYNVLLEEQAYPFEEKAFELHETNAKRASSGLYDEWVQKSFKALAELRPVRYGKNEREGAIDAIR